MERLWTESRLSLPERVMPRVGILILLAGTISAGESPVSAGLRHSCALLSDYKIKCFGQNAFGQLGTGDPADRGDGSGDMGDDLPAVNLGRGARAVGVAAGLTHSCALLDSGRVKCWGRNDWGQLGQGDTMDRGANATHMGDNLSPIDLGTGNDGNPLLATSVSVGDEFTCVLLEGSTVKCFGRNDEGQCGRGDLVRSVGSSPDDLGDELVAVSLGSNVTVDSISSGTVASCALLEAGTLKCWGSNAYGGLGLEDPYDRGDEESDMGDDLPEVDLGSGVTVDRVFYGLRHACAIVNGGMVKCWGDNRSGQLGLGHVNTIGDDSDEMGDNLPFVDLGPDGRATWLAPGQSHTCAVLAGTSDVKCWGKGFYGQLGDEQYEARGKYPGEMGVGLNTVNLGTQATAVLLGAGSDHTCAILDDGSLKCWGLNLDGSLGLDDTLPRGDDAGEMGNNLPTVDLGTNVTVSRQDLPTVAVEVVNAPPTPAPVIRTPSPTLLPTPAPTTLLTPAPIPPRTPIATKSSSSSFSSSLTPSPIPTLTSPPSALSETIPTPPPSTLEAPVSSPSSSETPGPSILPETPMPASRRGSEGLLETPVPTPSPTSAAGSTGSPQGGLKADTAEGSSGGSGDVFSSDSVLLASFVAPIATIAFILLVCFCRRRSRSRAALSSPSAAPPGSFFKSGGAAAVGAKGMVGPGELSLGGGYSNDASTGMFTRAGAENLPSPIADGIFVATGASIAASVFPDAEDDGVVSAGALCAEPAGVSGSACTTRDGSESTPSPAESETEDPVWEPNPLSQGD